MEKEIISAIITGCFTIVGTISGVLITCCFQRASAKKERQKQKIKNTYYQFATLFKLEELYISEIVKLRNSNGKECKEKGVMNEFRNRVYEEGFSRVEYNESSIKSIADEI